MTVEKVVAAPECYPRVREWAHDLRRAAPHGDGLTSAERDVLAAVAPAWDGDPEAIARLRHCGEAITGTRAADYDDAPAGTREPLEEQLARLLAKGERGFWVDEPEALGGFGWGGPVARFNEDTLRFFRAVWLLREASVLAEFQDPEPRATIWDIGGGWGGLTHQLRARCPNATYLITGHPELLLLSAVYLTTVFPGLRVRFHDASKPEAFWADWDAVDVAFAPESVLSARWSVAIDLAMDFGMLDRMTPGRIRAHIRKAHECGARYVLSFSPPGDRDRGVPSPVRDAIDACYWTHPMSDPAYVRRYFALPKGLDRCGRGYFLGWRRLLP